MEINVKQYLTSIYIIDLVGELDLYNSHNVKEVINKMIAEGKTKFILNLDELNYIDSGGIGSLISVYSVMRKNNLQFQIINIHGSVRQVIELTKLIGYFPISESLEDAISKME
jgi:anti-sigma B factor antagonist